MKLMILILLTLTFTPTSMAQEKGEEIRYTKVSAGYLIVLRKDDDVIHFLEKFAADENLSGANFTGMGFVDITFGFFDFETKQYKPRHFQKVELASMHGTLAWKDGAPSVHAHGVVSDNFFQSYGGHILNAVVSTGSVEILLIPHDKKLTRKEDERIGADVLQLE